MEILEYRGVEGLVLAEVTCDDNSSETGHGYVTGTVFELAGIGKLTKAVERASETHYYNNTPAVVIQGKGEDTITIDISAIAVDDLATICNHYYDSQTGMMVERDGDLKYFALGYKTRKNNGDEVYVWRLKGTIDAGGYEANTINAGTGANGQTIVYHGISTQHKFTKNDGVARSVVVDAGLDLIASPSAFFSTVQTPDTVQKKV